MLLRKDTGLVPDGLRVMGRTDLVKLDEKLSSKVDAMVAEMAQVKYQLQKQVHWRADGCMQRWYM